MKRCAAFAIALTLILFSSGCSKANQHDHREGAEANEVPGNAEVSGRLQDGIRVIELEASRYKFEPDPIVVNLGEKVRVIAASADVTHGIEIPDFKINLTIAPGKTSEAEFVADKKGTFHAHCSVYCGPGHGHMHGALIVK